MSVYYYNVGTPPNIATLVSTLQASILADLDLPVISFVSVIYNALTENVEVTFSILLSLEDTFILNNLASIVLFGTDPSNWYSYNANEKTRNSSTVSFDPTQYNDFNNGYRVGSIVTTSNDVFMCIDNTVNTAVWKKLTSTIGPTGSTGPTGNIGVMGPTGFMGATGPQGIIGPTGFMGNTGPSGVNGSGAIIAYSLIATTNITVISNFFPLAFQYSPITSLGSGLSSLSIMNSPCWKVPRSSTLSGISASVGINSTVGISLGGTINYTFSVFRAAAANGSTTIPTFSSIASTVVAMSIPTITLLTTIFNSNSSSTSVSLSQGDLIIVAVSINNTITLGLGSPALSLMAGLSIS